MEMHTEGLVSGRHGEGGPLEGEEGMARAGLRDSHSPELQEHLGVWSGLGGYGLRALGGTAHSRQW